MRRRSRHAAAINSPGQGGEFVERSQRLRAESFEVLHPLPRVIAIVRTLALILLFVLPFPFGAVHRTTETVMQLTVAGLLFITVAGLLGRSDIRSRIAERWGVLSRNALGIFLTIALIGGAQAAWFAFSSVPHPLLGSVSALRDSTAAADGIRAALGAAGAFLLVRLLCGWCGSAKLFVWTMLGSAAAVSLTALSHWLHDNGMLFWIFEPESVFVSPRARWPFVNSNHLAHFLLIPAICCFAFVARHLERKPLTLPGNTGELTKAARAFSESARVQRNIFALAGLGTLFLLLVMTIFVAQSRGGWFGFSVGFVVLHLALTSFAERHDREHGEADPKRKRRLTMRLIAMLIFIGGLGGVFMAQHAGQIISERLVAGVIASHDDIRWALYGDSIRMIREHPFFGIGLGQWAEVYNGYIRPELMGIVPEYLHNDPLQLLIELGLLGGGAVAVLAVLFGVRAVRAISHIPSYHRVTVAGILCGVLALLAAAFVDFPFRIPAITTYLSAWLAVAVFYLEDSRLIPERTFEVVN